MHLQARRIFRLATVPALTLALSYGLALPLPYIAPLFAFMLTAMPAPPMGLKSLLGLVIVVMILTSVGILLIPLLLYFQFTAFLIIAVGLFLSSYLTINLGKNLFGTFMTIGFTMIAAAGTVDDSVATLVIEALAKGISLAVICQWIVYPFFPEDPAEPETAAPVKETGEQSIWLALRSVIIVLPAVWLVLTNPLAYMPVVLKSVFLSQQSSIFDARSAGRELLGSTLLGGVFAVLMWMLLGVYTNLWMFFLLMLLAGIYFASKMFGMIKSRLPASFWMNVAVTMLILLGPAVEDSANGKDVYAAFFVRMGLFVLITFYAWIAIYLLEKLRSRKLQQTKTCKKPEPPDTEITSCS